MPLLLLPDTAVPPETDDGTAPRSLLAGPVLGEVPHAEGLALLHVALRDTEVLCPPRLVEALIR